MGKQNDLKGAGGRPCHGERAGRRSLKKMFEEKDQEGGLPIATKNRKRDSKYGRFCQVLQWES